MPEADTLMNARSSLNAAPSRRWYVAQSHVHAESKAASHLCRQGFDVYLPRYRQRVAVQKVDHATREVVVLLGTMRMKVSFDELASFESR